MPITERERGSSDIFEVIDELRNKIDQRRTIKHHRVNWRKVARWTFVAAAIVSVLIPVLICIFH